MDGVWIDKSLGDGIEAVDPDYAMKVLRVPDIISRLDRFLKDMEVISSGNGYFRDLRRKLAIYKDILDGMLKTVESYLPKSRVINVDNPLFLVVANFRNLLDAIENALEVLPHD